jgi:transcriptional regulator with XRE-family HTH domain
MFDALVTSRAHPITVVIAQEVRRLRGAARLSGAALTERLNGYGIPWNRTTVAKLERGDRESVSVQEWLALAVVLGTTPLALITDPRIGRSVPLAEDFEVDPWIVARWARGDGHNAERDSRLQVDYDTWTVFDLVHAIPDLCRKMARPPAEGEDQNARDRALLRLLRSHLEQAAQLGAAPYPVPAAVRGRADELGMPLPGQDS